MDYTTLKEKAILLRRQGLSYSEILKQIPVAKSTLSLWLHSVDLSKKQKQRLTEKKLASIRRGAIAKRNQRIETTKIIKEKAQNEIKSISERELWLIGIALYWAEGSKEKEWRPGSRAQFTNSDPYMVKLFLKWLTNVCKIDKNNISFAIYIHKRSKNNINKVINYWSGITNFPKNCFAQVYFKKNKISTKRKNTGNFYFGLLRITIKSSSSLNRKISGWIEGICKNCRVV